MTSTILYGEHEAVLVDARLVRENIDAFCDLIDATGCRLTTIYITHGHAEHYFGMDRIMQRFAASRAVATRSVVEYLSRHAAAEFTQFSAIFGEELVLPTSLPEPLELDFVEFEGERLCIIEVGQGDIPHSTVLHVSALDAVFAGEVAYNVIHQMLGLGGPVEWRAWIDSIDKVARLAPRTVIAGHMQPGASDDAVRILEETRSYIQDFSDLAAASDTARDIVTGMVAKYPSHGNLTTLLFSASAAIKARGGAPQMKV